MPRAFRLGLLLRENSSLSVALRIGPTAPVGLGLDSNGSVLSSIGGVRMTFLPSNSAAPLIYASSGQINAVVPYEIARSLNPSLVVKFVGQTSNVYPLTLTTTVPAQIGRASCRERV